MSIGRAQDAIEELSGGALRGLLRLVGPQAVEAALIRKVQAYRESVARDPGLLKSPLLIVVSSDFLRQRLMMRLTREFDGALLGVRVATMTSLASELCRGRGRRIQGSRLLPLLIQRALYEDETLRGSLGDLESGASTVVGAVGDLLDAGFDPALDEVLLESLASEDPFQILPEHSVDHPDLTARVESLVRLTSCVASELAFLNLELPGQLLLRASEALEGGQELNFGSILIHGFAETTGAASRFLEALVAHQDALLLLSTPPDPARPGKLDLGSRFTERLSARLRSYGYTEDLTFPDHSAAVDVRVARGTQAEVNEVALRILALLDNGIGPERIALTCRDLEPYKNEVRKRFSSLGIPFSAAKTPGPMKPERRWFKNLLRLLSEGDQLTVEPWLDLCAQRLLDPSEGHPVAMDELRLKVLEFGIARIADLSSLVDLPMGTADSDLETEVLRGLDDDPSGKVTGRRRVLRCQVSREDLQSLGRLTRETLEHIGAAPAMADFSAHQSWIKRLSLDFLGWGESDPRSALLDEVLRQTGQWVPDDFPLTSNECIELLQRAFEKDCDLPLGGAGGGVAVINAMEARGCTFEHLFILGMNRGSFPRSSVEDPMLPDSHRLRLRNSDVLPDIPIKQGGNAEERYLFAELLASSREVHLSWLQVDDDGRDCSASPFIERLRGLRGLGPDKNIPLARGPRSTDGGPHRSASDFSVLYALHGDRTSLAQLWSLTNSDHIHIEAAAALLSVLNEQDPDLSSSEGRETWRSYSPYLGQLGPSQSLADPRVDTPFVTTVESFARCPWQSLLSIYLGLKPVPDPYLHLPGLERYQLGNLVHEALHVMGRWTLEAALDEGSELPRSVEDVQENSGVPMQWPPDAEILRLLNNLARRLLLEHNRGFVGLAPAIAAHASNYVQVVRDFWQDRGGLRILGSELKGEISLAGAGTRTSVRFKVDCMHESREGIELVDYKTGRAPKSRDLMTRVRQGTQLQSAVYAALGEQYSGTYVFCGPERAPGRAPSFSTDEAPGDYAQVLERTLTAVQMAVERGVVFPRVVEPEKDAEPRACTFCQVKEACIRGDSGARTRLKEWAKGEHPETREEIVSAFGDLWDLATGRLEDPAASDEGAER